MTRPIHNLVGWQVVDQASIGAGDAHPKGDSRRLESGKTTNEKCRSMDITSNNISEEDDPSFHWEVP